MQGTRFTLEVRPRIPAVLDRLEVLANDLLYSWDRGVRSLFYRLDSDLWDCCSHNPKVFLRRISQQALDNAVQDRSYMEEYRRVIIGYDSYKVGRINPEMAALLNPEEDLVAYFCAEFGLHESFPIYSGGLGILAGDHCKAASDLGIPFIGVGLLYQKGYFIQTIDEQGNQQAQYMHCGVDDLPIVPALTASGEHLQLDIEFPGRTVTVRVWQAKAGHINLLLLDTDVPQNNEHDRSITHQLYGGGTETRIMQEIILGIGGTRALRVMGKKPSVWHINEGHSAFQILERCRFHVQRGLDFDSALELVAAGTVFTTHTPVPAGHDIFSHDLINTYFGHYTEGLGIDFATLFQLGQAPHSADGFNMTVLAIRGSRYHNGVSRIHGSVASSMESGLWPQIPQQENPIDYVTNGVHVQTFLAREWVSLFDLRFDDWQSELLNNEFWDRINEIPDHQYWSVHKAIKQQMLEDVCLRINQQHLRNGSSHAHTLQVLSAISDPDSDILVMGFARRFATYKRATLLFSDPQRLSNLLNNADRPGVIIFAGKAHPNDVPGQHLIRVIHEFSMRPEFIGKIILLEGYDMALARKLVSGVDVWLNTPEYPLEASGTSGQKAAINGAINLSVLDGWWGEGYNHENGWGITPRGVDHDLEYRNREEAHDLIDILEHEVFPNYYDRDGRGYSKSWVAMSKASMQSIMPRFNSQRMLRDYVTKFYSPAQQHRRIMLANEGANARLLSEWKKKVQQCWPGVSMHLQSAPPDHASHGDTLPLRLRAQLNGLAADDVVVECLVGQSSNPDETMVVAQKAQLKAAGESDGGVEFTLDLLPQLSGLQFYKIRMYPYHQLLCHRFETGAMIWL
jgi:starch phosphorylase